ncbi:hypothetical protein QDR37_10310 [Amnibacterium sp. CER49]|uniref:PH-like domain-containing protein n=1 Tax=Amnibacterium sp. CER49 TaxID=3039161 RepID=UPI0024499F8B|nr:hypothetical protein [Amnibacterium sp. CER49]MDH2444334.1 hypothetical protein [Amnibacterium sp. CER49]
MIPVPAVAAVSVALLAAIAGMGVSWRRRKRDQQGLALPDAPAEQGEERIAVDGLHLATTFAGRPLERVVVAGLGFRFRARIVVTDRGVRIERDGGHPLHLPAGRLTGAGTATWTLDRGVEPGGLTVLGFTLDSSDGPVAVESSFRIDPEPRARLIAAVQAITAGQPKETPHADS